MNKHPLLTGLLGGCISIVLVTLAVLLLHKQQQIFNPVYIVTTQYEVNDTTINNIQSFEVKEKLAEIKKLNEKGVLLTPQEYTSHIETFYNNIIAVLVALLAIFSLVTYFHLKFIAKEEVQVQVKDLIKNSPEIQRIIDENINGKIDDAIYDTIDESMATKEDLAKAIMGLKNELRIANIEDESELSRMKIKKGQKYGSKRS